MTQLVIFYSTTHIACFLWTFRHIFCARIRLTEPKHGDHSSFQSDYNQISQLLLIHIPRLYITRSLYKSTI